MSAVCRSMLSRSNESLSSSGCMFLLSSYHIVIILGFVQNATSGRVPFFHFCGSMHHTELAARGMNKTP